MILELPSQGVGSTSSWGDAADGDNLKEGREGKRRRPQLSETRLLKALLKERQRYQDIHQHIREATFEAFRVPSQGILSSMTSWGISPSRRRR